MSNLPNIRYWYYYTTRQDRLQERMEEKMQLNASCVANLRRGREFSSFHGFLIEYRSYKLASISGGACEEHACRKRLHGDCCQERQVAGADYLQGNPIFAWCIMHSYTSPSRLCLVSRIPQKPRPARLRMKRSAVRALHSV